MNFVSDALTIGLVLILLFGSIALYLYTRIQHSEQKINLLESILLDLKMGNEIKSYTELPADEDGQEQDQHQDQEQAHVQSKSVAAVSQESYSPFVDEVSEEQEEQEEQEASLISVLDNKEVEHANIKSNSLSSISIDMPLASSSMDQKPMDSKVNYDSMTLKELQAAAKSKGVTGVHTKAQLTKALKALEPMDANQGLSSFLGNTTQALEAGHVGQNSFIETSASVSE